MAASALIGLISAGTTALTGGTLLGGFLVGGAGTLFTHFLVTTAMGAALNALTPKPSLGAVGQRGFSLRGESGAALDHQIIYGEARVGGARVYDASSGNNNRFLHRILAFAGHEIDSYQEIYLNDEVVTIDGSGNVTSPSQYVGHVRIKTYLGTSTQTADPDLVSDTAGLADGSWTTDHRLQGIAYIYVRFEYDQDAFPNGVPSVSAKIRGKKVFDPRTSTTAWSDNPALCIRDYLTSDYGLDQNSGRIQDSLVQVAANICDQTVEGEKRYTCNGAFRTASAPSDILTDLLTSMGGLLWYGQGKWRMKASAWSTPTVTFDEDDLRSGISLSTRHSRRDNFNAVKGTFSGDETEWQVTDYPEVTDPAFLAADNNVPNVLDFPLPFTSSSLTAQRVARIALSRNREQLTFSAAFGMRAFQVQVGDFVYINNTRFGWVNKAFEITEWNFGLTDGLDLHINMTLREISEGVFTGVDGSEFELNNTSLPDPFAVAQPTLDAAVAETFVNNDGTVVPSIKFSWSVTDNSFVDYYDFQWKLSTDSTWSSLVVKDETQFILAPAISGAAYDYRVRAVNTLGVKSAYTSSVSPVSTGDDGTTPNAPTNLTAEAGAESIKISWDAPTQNTDGSTVLDVFQYRIYRNDSNNFGTANLVGRISGDVFTDGSLTGGVTYYYWVTAVDFTGNESSESTVASATANAIDTTRSNGVFYIGVTTLPTTSSGAHTDFTNAIGDPVDRDQAWFYTGTLQNPTDQTVWIYEEGSGIDPASSWNFQENVMVGDLIVDGTVTTPKLDAQAVTTDKIAAGAVGSVQIADDIQSDNYSAGSAGWKISRDTGNAEFNDVTIRGTLSATVIDASQPFYFLTGNVSGSDYFAPLGAFDYAASGVSSASNASQITSDIFYGPTGGTPGYNARRVARFSAPVFQIEGEFNHYRATGTATLRLQVSVDGGAFTDIFSTSNLLFGQSATGVQERIVTTYTTPASFNTLQFRARGEQAGRSYIRVTLDNWL